MSPRRKKDLHAFGNERDQIKAPMSAKAGRETDCNAGGASISSGFLCNLLEIVNIGGNEI